MARFKIPLLSRFRPKPVSSPSMRSAQRHLEQAYDLYVQDEFDEALREIDKGIDQAPEVAEAHNLRGMILEDMDRREEAVDAYRKAQLLDPTDEVARESLLELEGILQDEADWARFGPPSPAEIAAEEAIDDAMFERGMGALKSRQNLGLGILAGVAAAILGVITWSLVTLVAGRHIGWLAIGVGFVVGLAVRWAGKGIDRRFGVAGALLALLACLAGTVLTACVIISRENDAPLIDLLISLDLEVAARYLRAYSSSINLLFYGIAVYAGWRVAVSGVDLAEVESLAEEIPPYSRP